MTLKKVCTALAVLNVIGWSAVALADRVTQALSSRAYADTVTMQRAWVDAAGTDAGVEAGWTMVVCGHTIDQLGKPTAQECYPCNVDMPLSNADIRQCYKTGAGL